MRINRLQISGFGKFTDQEFTFEPGLNLVYGENEAGKSTLQSFLRGMLFGFKKQGIRRSYDELLERYRPWTGGAYSGVLEYLLEDKPYRVERNFEPDEEKVKILDGITWEDITASFQMDKRKEVLFAQEHLGISQVIFDNTVCVRQLQNKSGQDLAEEIQSKLVNLASAGEEEVSIQHALQALDGKLKELGITERSGKTPLGKVTALVEELERARQDTLKGYEDIRGDEARRQGLAEELAGLHRSLQGLASEAKFVQLQTINAKLTKAISYEQRIQELSNKLQDLAKYAGFPLAEKDNFLQALERSKTIQTNSQAHEQRLTDLASKISFKAQTIERLQQYILFTQEDTLALEQGFTRLEETASLAQELERKKQELLERRRVVEEKFADLAGCAKLGPEGEAEVNRLEEEISELKLNSALFDLDRLQLSEANLVQQIKGKKIVASLFASLGLIFGLGLGVFVHYGLGLTAFVGLGLAVWLWRGTSVVSGKLTDVRKRIKDAKLHTSDTEGSLVKKSQRIQELLRIAGVANSRELNEKMRQLALVQQSKQSSYLDLVKLEGEMSKLRQRLREDSQQLEVKFLAPAQIMLPGQSVTREMVMEFCGGVSSYLSLKTELASLGCQEQELLSQRQNILSEVYKAEEQLQRIMKSAEVTAAHEFLTGCQFAQEYIELQKSRDALVTARDEALGQANIQELMESKHKLAGEIEHIPEGCLRNQEEISTEFDALSARITQTKESIANLQGIIETRLKGAKNLSDIEQQLSEAWQEKEKILKKRRALEIARQAVLEVSQAVQREFSPLLNQHIGKTINSLTAGRYLASKIDHNLQIKVVVPETGEVKDISSLSLGTVDQFYFGLRLALADLLGVKFPLVLDDAFIQYDDERLKEALQLLCNLAKERQIILFSCHRREKELLTELGPEKFNLIAL